MYALISVYDDTNKCIYKNNALTPNMVNHDGEYTTYRFGFSITIAEHQAPTMNGKLKHDDIPDILDELPSDENRIQVYLKDLEVGQTFYWRELDYDMAMVVWKDYTMNRIHYIDKHGTFSKGGNIKVWIKKTVR